MVGDIRLEIAKEEARVKSRRFMELGKATLLRSFNSTNNNNNNYYYYYYYNNNNDPRQTRQSVPIPNPKLQIMCLIQSFKFRSVSVGTAGIFRSISKIGTEHDIKNFVLCTVLFRPEWPK